MIPLTLHRRENLALLPDIYAAIAREPCARCRFVLPLHPNARARAAALAQCAASRRFVCCNPFSYAEMQVLPLCAVVQVLLLCALPVLVVHNTTNELRRE